MTCPEGGLKLQEAESKTARGSPIFINVPGKASSLGIYVGVHRRRLDHRVLL
jgi:hypothetical protein